jgi:uncharacterized membrane protein
MISNPFVLALLLIAIVCGVLFLEKKSFVSRLFHYLPSPFWCYFLPMLLASAGILPSTSPVYDFLTTYVLAGCLILLLLNIDLRSIVRLGPTALSAVAVGTAGIALGATTMYALLARWLPPESWKGVGALSASWTGGSANMLAVKEGLGTPDDVFAPLVIVDTAVTYTWMGILVAMASLQEKWDRWVHADRSRLDDVSRRIAGTMQAGHLNKSLAMYAPLLAIGLALGAGCLYLGGKLPAIAGVINRNGWAFLIASALGIVLSFTPAAQLERYGASRVGYFCLYLLLAAIGSKAHLQAILAAPLFMLLGFGLALIHLTVLFLYGYFRRVPMFFLATASQADIGGTASTPIVAGVYQPRLAGVGLLLALAVNVVGTYIGYAIAYLCRIIHA